MPDGPRHATDFALNSRCALRPGPFSVAPPGHVCAGRRATSLLRRGIFRLHWIVQLGLNGLHRAEHDDGFTRPVFGSEPDLIAREVQNDMVDRATGRKAQRAPFHGDFPAADTEKPPKIDNGGAHVAVAFDDYVDDLTHVLVGIAANALPENALYLAIVNDGCGGTVLGEGRSLWLGLSCIGHLICRFGSVRTVQGSAK